MPLAEQAPYHIMTNAPAMRTTLAEQCCFAVMVIWGIKAIFRNRRYRRLNNAQVDGFYRYTYLAMLVNIIAYTVFKVVVFSTRSVAGYNEIDTWQWLDTSKAFEPVYYGEWLAFIFLYAMPLIMALFRHMTLRNHARKIFEGVYCNMYPWIIMITYAGFFAVSMCLPDDLRHHMFHRPLIDMGER